MDAETASKNITFKKPKNKISKKAWQHSPPQ